MASVTAILTHAPPAPAPAGAIPPTGAVLTPEAITAGDAEFEFVVALLADANVDASVPLLKPGEAELLGWIQKNVSTLEQRAAAAAKTKDKKPPSGCFTVRQVQSVLGRLSCSAIDQRLNALADGGYLERHGKFGHAYLWRLTEAGAQFRRRKLDVALDQYLARLKLPRLTPPAGHNPKKLETPPEGSLKTAEPNSASSP